MNNTNTLRILIEAISESNERIKCEIAYERFYRIIEIHFKKAYQSLCWHLRVHPNSGIDELVFEEVMTEMYFNIRDGEFRAERYESAGELLKGVIKWLLEKAEWRLNTKLNVHTRRKTHISFVSEIANTNSDSGEDKGQLVLNQRHETFGGMTAVEADISYRELRARIDRALTKMCRKYADIITLCFLTEQNPMKPIKAEKEILMEKHNIKTELDFNTAKSRAVERLRKLLDSGDENE